MLSDIRNAGPAFIPAYDAALRKVTLSSPNRDQARWNKEQLEEECLRVFREAAANACPDHHPDRLVFALAGRILQPEAPRPFGGKKNTGFAEFQGSTGEELMRWIVEKATEPPVSGRGRKRAAPGAALTHMVLHFNEVLGMHRGGVKDEVDEIVLKGMSRAGILGQGSSGASGTRIVLPEYLRQTSRRSQGEPLASVLACVLIRKMRVCRPAPVTSTD
ncbi:hypothetical protein HDU96_000783 [Phlyctochytrium bullatum]|nr:hypothetical protein HDU96_000783 [Phlyctochytrium bullatum]